MLPPDEGLNEEVMLCPACGSSDVEKTDTKYRICPGNNEMNEYKCKACGATYFPAMESHDKTGIDKMIETWGRKTDHDNWLNNMRNKKITKIYFIRESK